ncbi:Transposable element Tcb2 transposase [Trichostrongylus colubriformis]|uniref:Transposable element Tcb2 transposase n=1 Tax=Trichostrongylus colubriformis TaxID=6319 RepID=A0AAN8G5G2_TRICO
MIDTAEDFSQCIFSDETTIQVGPSVKHCFVKGDDYFARLRPRAKHPVKLNLWGGISMRGATELAIFPGAMRLDSKKYCEILERCYVPFARKIFNGFGILVQDNAPAHRSAYTAGRLKTMNVRLLDWPPESPDLNPIELVWGSMKAFVRKKIHEPWSN